MPESFNVLVKKLRGLCLDVQVKTEKERKSWRRDLEKMF
jgi:DNA-directed RNA polymerase beta subunit